MFRPREDSTGNRLTVNDNTHFPIKKSINTPLTLEPAIQLTIPWYLHHSTSESRTAHDGPRINRRSTYQSTVVLSDVSIAIAHVSIHDGPSHAVPHASIVCHKYSSPLASVIATFWPCTSPSVSPITSSTLLSRFALGAALEATHLLSQPLSASATPRLTSAPRSSCAPRPTCVRPTSAS